MLRSAAPLAALLLSFALIGSPLRADEDRGARLIRPPVFPCKFGLEQKWQRFRTKLPDATAVHALIQEDSAVMALVRRFVPYGDFIPQKFAGTVKGQPVCEFRQHFNPIIQKITLDFSQDTDNLLDRRLGLAAAILLSAIEERQGGGGLGVDV